MGEEKRHITELPEGEMYVTPLYVGEGRTLEQAMAHAEELRRWLTSPVALLTQGEFFESDFVLLADEIKRLRKENNSLEMTAENNLWSGTE